MRTIYAFVLLLWCVGCGPPPVSEIEFDKFTGKDIGHVLDRMGPPDSQVPGKMVWEKKVAGGYAGTWDEAMVTYDVKTGEVKKAFVSMVFNKK